MSSEEKEFSKSDLITSNLEISMNITKAIEKHIEQRQRALQTLIRLRKEMKTNPELKEQVRRNLKKVLQDRGLPESLADAIEAETKGLESPKEWCICTAQCTVTKID